MIASTISYIESDFSSADETAAEYRRRTASPARGHYARRAYRRLRRNG